MKRVANLPEEGNPRAVPKVGGHRIAPKVGGLAMQYWFEMLTG